MKTENVCEYSFEYTDTFGGEANYSWVKRGSVFIPIIKGEHYKKEETRIIKAVKQALGLTGIRCAKYWQGETLCLKPSGSCTIVFIY
jgi:hypothetical protein